MMDEIAVDEERLVALIGRDFHLSDWRDRMAARVITDSSRERGSHAITNARAWIDYAYQAGLETGRRETEAAWQRKLRGIFGI